ncbi:MAG: response regulator [Candidatus Binatia bacterium]
MRILVVEDDKKIGSFVTRGLKEAGFVVDRAEDGASGLDLALAATYDAIIMDLMLPRLDGLSIVEELRSRCQIVGKGIRRRP